MVEVTCSGLLFDLDGVLVDSTPAVARVWSRFAARHGFEPEETVRRAHGRPSLETVRELLPNSDYVAENEFVLRGEIDGYRRRRPAAGGARTTHFPSRRSLGNCDFLQPSVGRGAAEGSRSADSVAAC